MISNKSKIGNNVEIHPLAYVEDGVEIGDNTKIGPFCIIRKGSKIGKNVHLANNVTIGGSVSILNNNFVGCGSTISPGAKINTSNVIIGAGSTVIKIINNSGVYVGSPAKIIKSTDGKLNGVPTWEKITL